MPAISDCRICGRGLSNPRSLAVSMGPVCAKRFGVIFDEALAYATSIGVQLDSSRLREQAELAAQQAYEQRIRRRQDGSGNGSLPEDQVVQVYSATRGQYEYVRVEFDDERRGRVISPNGNSYGVTNDSCTCPHYRYRLAGSGGETCRHIDAYREANNRAQGQEPQSLNPYMDEFVPPINSIVDAARHEEVIRTFEEIDWEEEEARESVLETWSRNRSFDGTYMSRDDEAFETLMEEAENDWDYKYEGVLGGTGNTFGIEIELIVPRNVSERQLTQALYNEGVIDNPRVNGYHSGSAGPGYWKLERDGSLRGDGWGVELISPVLRDNQESWSKLERACKKLQELGCTTNRSCGGHIHLGVAPLDHRTYSWQRLSRIGLAYEKTMYRMGSADNLSYSENGTPGRHRGTTYANPMNDRARAISGEDTAEEARRKITPGKYSMINARGVDARINRKPTVEMRYPNSTLDFKQWQAQVQVTNSVVHQAAVMRNESPNSQFTPGLCDGQNQLRLNDRCSQSAERDHFRKFLDVLGNREDRKAAAFLFKRGRA